MNTDSTTDWSPRRQRRPLGAGGVAHRRRGRRTGGRRRGPRRALPRRGRRRAAVGGVDVRDLPTSLGGGGATLSSWWAPCAHWQRTARRAHSCSPCTASRRSTSPGTATPLRCGTSHAHRDRAAAAGQRQQRGGDRRRRRAEPVRPRHVGHPWSLDKQALAISYGEHADVILGTARRTPTPTESDQVFTVMRRSGSYAEPTSEWDTLGLRGTCSRGFTIRARVDPELLFPVPFAVVFAKTFVNTDVIALPVASLLCKTRDCELLPSRASSKVLFSPLI